MNQLIKHNFIRTAHSLLFAKTYENSSIGNCCRSEIQRITIASYRPLWCEALTMSGSNKGGLIRGISKGVNNRKYQLNNCLMLQY